MSRDGTRRGPVVGLAVLVLLATLSVSCGGQDGATATTAPETAPEGTSTAPTTAPTAAEVRVGLTEWTVLTSATAARSGAVELVVTNAGATAHDLTVRGEAGEWRTDKLAPGEGARLLVTARPGETLVLWCDRPGHRSQGMETTLPVAED